MLINMMIVGGLGIMIKYVLVPGFKSNEIYGKNVELFFLGYDRHQWGTIHLISSLAFLSLLVIHIILHWKMVNSIFSKMIIKRNQRRIIGFTLVLASSLLALGPLFISPVVNDSMGHNRHAYAFHRNDTLENSNFNNNPVEIKDKQIEVQKDKQNEHIHSGELDIEIFGNMTIIEVSEKYNISSSYLKSQLGVPKTTPDGSKLGQLRKRHNFTMRDVKFIISNELKDFSQNEIY